MNTSDALSEDFFLGEDSYIRDRIIILGRRSSGKTVYLSALYSKLWESLSSFRIKAIKGPTHLEFFKVIEDLKDNKWPPATQGVSENILELIYNEQKETVVALDYPGEVFTNAFVKEIETKETNILLDHIDHARALIILIDPEHVAKGDFHSKIDNDFGLLQAVNRIHDWPDGKDVPIVLVMTKADKSYPIIKKHGGTKAFIVKHFSRLIRDVDGLKGCCVSAYASLDDNNALNKHTVDIEEPLLYCLEKIKNRQEDLTDHRKKARYHDYIQKLDREEKSKETRDTILILITSFLVFILLLYLADKILPSTVWHNLWQNTLGRFIQ